MALLPATIGIILSPDQTEVLLVKRDDIPVWVLPGGGVEVGEQPEEALVREIQEETGFQVEIQRKCAEYSPLNRLCALTSIFICNIVSGENCLSSETRGIAFHSLLNLPSTLFPPHERWLHEALSTETLIQRPLIEVSYGALWKYFIRHPHHVLRFAWTRFVKF